MSIVSLMGKLEDVCIERYLDEVNFKLDDDDSNDLYLCDVIVEHLVNGDFNDVYESEILEEFDEKEREKILDVVSKNSDICFTNNSYEYWLDSIKFLEVNDYKYALKVILDNYEFLLNVCVRCGADKVKLLSSIKDEKFHIDRSIVNSIRDGFENDEEIFSLLNSSLSENVIKKNIIKAMEDDILHNDIDYNL